MRKIFRRVLVGLVVLSLALIPVLPFLPSSEVIAAGAMEQVIFGGIRDLLDDTATEYESPIGGSGWDATESRKYKLISTDGVIKNLRVKLDGSPGAGKHYDFTLMVNGAPAALTLEIADAATSGSNMVNEIDVAPGDTISIQCAPSGTPTARNATWTIMFEGDTANESLILGGSSESTDSTNTEFGQVMGTYSPYSTVENDFRQVIPTAGIIKNFYVKLNADPGVAPDAYTFTVRLNGATVGESLIVTITADDTTGSDLAHNLVVAAGDIVTMMIVPTDSPDSVIAQWGMTFVADTDGESIVLGGSSNDLDNTTTEYHLLNGHSAQFWSPSEPWRLQLGQVCTLKKLYMLLSAAPGVGNKYDFTVRIAGAGSNVVATVSGAATTGNSGALEDTVANDEYVGLQVVPDSTPDAADAYWGLVCYIPVISSPTVTTQAVGDITDTTATGNGNITAIGGENADFRGIVWDLASQGAPGDVAPGASGYANNVQEGPGSYGIGAFTRSLTGLPTGDTIYARAWAHNSGGYGYGAEVNFLTKPAAPTNVAATEGSETDKVVVTWTKSTGATNYRVYEGANDISGLLGDVATYDDSAAAAGTISNAGIATASDGTSAAHVTLSLASEATTNGAARTYKVVASNATGTSDDSGTNQGFRGVGSITYQWQRSAADSDADYGNIGGATTDPYNDTGAPAPTITPGNAVAGDGSSTAHVALSLAGTSLNDGDGRYFQCIVSAVDASNTPQTSDNNRGYRGGGSLGYQWQRSLGTGDEDYSNIDGATSSTYNDTAAPAGIVTPGTGAASDGTSSVHITLSVAGESVANGAVRYYKCVLGSAGAGGQTSGSNEGYRATGGLTYQWQRSAADSNASYSSLGGATTDPYNDTTAPAPGQGRWYYCEVSATGTTTQDSTHDRGYRLSAPTVTTSTESSVEETTATLNGEITFTGNQNATARGFQWDTDSGAPYAFSWYGTGDFGTGIFDHGITGLTEGDCYYYRAYATNPTGTGYGSEEKFLTKPVAPNTLDAVVGGATQVDLTWVKGAGAQKTYIRGEDGSYPDDRDDGYLVYNDTAALCSDTGLTGGHAYYYRAWSYATEDGESQYSDDYAQDSLILTLGLELWYQPETIISGTALIDRQGSFDGVITWDGRLADGGDVGVLTDSVLTQVDDYWVGYTLKIKEVAGDAAPEGEEAEITDSTLATLGGTADSGTATTLIDAELTQTTAYWAAQTLTIVTTTDSGAPQGESKTVTTWDLPTNTLTFPAMTAVVDTGDTYTLTAANSLFFDNLTAVVGANARYEIWDGQIILWGSFPEGIKVTVGSLTAYTDPVSEAVGLEDPEVAGIPQEPDELWGGTADSDLPMYPLFSAVANSLGWTTDVLYVVAWMIVSIGLGLALLITTGSTLGAIAGVGVGMAGGMATGMLPVWVLIVYLVLGITWLYTSRSM